MGYIHVINHHEPISHDRIYHILYHAIVFFGTEITKACKEIEYIIKARIAKRFSHVMCVESKGFGFPFPGMLNTRESQVQTCDVEPLRRQIFCMPAITTTQVKH